MDIKRVFLIVLDSVGIGELPDADRFGDAGSNTLLACFKTGGLNMPNMASLGFFNIDGVCDTDISILATKAPKGSFARMKEKSMGKDTTIGHWEIAGVISENPLPTYPNGFPTDVIEKLEKAIGRKVICNKPYSGTAVIHDYGEEHIKDKSIIVYTSADSVMQIAAHEEVIPIDELYDICKKARKIMQGENAVGRIIARPFVGEYPNFTRTSNRHDFSLNPPHKTMLDFVKDKGLNVIGVGKISDIFAGCGITETHHIKNNSDGMAKTIEIAKRDFSGLCFVNLVDFDMLYGHRNDAKGYTNALNKFDEELAKLIANLNADDVLMITADHGCDPSTPSTDHSREHTPLVIFGEGIKAGVNLSTRESFADIGKTICEMLEVENDVEGNSFYNLIKK